MPPRVTSTGGVVNLVSVGNKNIMAQRLDPAFVKAQFELAGYKMIGDYINANTPIEIICNKNHHSKMQWSNFSSGKRCLQCAGKYITEKEVKVKLSLEGYSLLDKYINAKTLMKMTCRNGHLIRKSWNSFQAGRRCAICSGKENFSSKFVSDKFMERGYTLLGSYKNSKTPVAFVCDKGHEHKMSFSSFMRGTKCGICSGRYVSKERVQSAFEREGYLLLSDYKNSHDKLEFVCPKGHRHSISWGHFVGGKRCAHCAGQILLVDSIFAVFEAKGWEVLSFKNTNELIDFKCEKGHIYKIAWKHAKAGVGCGICHHSRNYAIQYTNPVEKTIGRIKGSITKEIQRQKINDVWRSFYSKDDLLEIALNISDMYKYCKKGMHVDHILPKSWFNLLNKNELVFCWSLSNLRYLLATDNIRRSKNPTVREVEFMKKKYPILFNSPSRNPFAKAKQLELALCL